MSNIFKQYGIKEVANVYFEALADDTKNQVRAGDIVLYLDSLKVSTIEQAAEQVDARGGWGNPKLVTWDYNKEITLTLEDALISMESLRFVLGGAIKQENTSSPVEIARTEEAIVETEDTVPTLTDHITGEELTIPATGCRYLNMTTGTRGTMTSASEGLTAAVGDRVRFFWTEEKKEANGTAVEITISPNTFPGAYRVVGDTFIRDTNNDDHAFQFIINKAKVSSNVTITLEAEGDPSTFEMTLTVLRDESGNMMRLVSYD